ncbi:class I SAM-dependent methyltransferase [Arthrobacter sp. zg-Y20]|uniref:class I SAM-dependent methyltransferase n=1 Tax=unclassified Arthrobacter TaxID=235627 RepID=UPI001D14AA59|nr:MULTISPECIES: class I SAM-dependent methyltransferase [unclassified Arthrobacter]MCC3275299.1 class I SAM-dependent methyltransferase [Arthrobacter sp. zg-Y20]MDK1315457.1 class I SAM-dependent methyltransferase [Arthrobacter sp. zg.Y20]WIB05874.1 class I SAM-dependent methyltransferase [Arthrobacter sp. zg-Y20]
MNEPGINRRLRAVEDLLTLMDGLFVQDAVRWTETAGGAWWNSFYSDRSRPVPFFADKPDENLAALVRNTLHAPIRVLDLGSGPGRNALFLAEQGCTVDAVDLSSTAVEWGKERARDRNLDVAFTCGDAFTLPPEAIPGPYGLVYDSGCLHHLPPHRRISYLQLLERTLAPGGYFGLACFASGQMGSELPDDQLYRDGQFEAGMAFSPADLRWIFEDFEEIAIRPMIPQGKDSPLFGEPFLLTALFRKPEA